MPLPLLIKSSDRIGGSASSSNFTINFGRSFSKIVKVRYDWSCIPLSVFQVDSTNNIIYFRENSTNKQATLNNGYYNADELATEAARAINAASGGYATWQVAYNATTFKYTIQSNLAFTLQWGTFGGPYTLFGYTAVDSVGVSGVGVFTSVSTQSVQLNTLLGINVWIDKFNTETQSGNGPFMSCFKLFLPSSLGTVAIHEPYRDIDQDFPAQTFKALDIMLKDLDGNVINLNNHNWAMHLTCFTEDDIDEMETGRPAKRARK